MGHDIIAGRGCTVEDPVIPRGQYVNLSPISICHKEPPIGGVEGNILRIKIVEVPGTETCDDVIGCAIDSIRTYVYLKDLIHVIVGKEEMTIIGIHCCTTGFIREVVRDKARRLLGKRSMGVDQSA